MKKILLALFLLSSPAFGAAKKVTNADIAANAAIALSKIADNTNLGYLPGRSGGQTLKGGTASGDDLTLMSTNHATKGSIFFGNSSYDEANERLCIGGSSLCNWRTTITASADDYAHGVGICHALGGVNSCWRLYSDLNTTFSIYNPALAHVGIIIANTGLVTVGGATITQAGAGTFSTLAATTFTGAVVGNASTATALAANPTDCSTGEFATGIAANGNLTCAVPASGSSSATASTATTPISNPENLLSTGPGASPTNVAIQYWRLGDRMYVSGTLNTAGTTYGPPAFMAVPEGLSIDTTKLGLSNTVGNPGKMVGMGMMGTANVNVPVVTAGGTNASTIYFGNSLNSAAHLTPTGFSSVFSASALLSFDYNIPIKEWSNVEPSSGTITGDCTGGSLTSSGDYDTCIYDTAGSYTFTFSSEVGAALYTVEAIGGGGSGGAGSSGGGGGAGGFCRGVGLSAANGALSLAVGAGGAGANGAVGNNGSDTTFDGATAKGGGKGGYADGTANANGSDGGSGGGGGDDSSANTAGAVTQVTSSGNLTCYGSVGGVNYGASPFNAGGGGSPTMPGESVGPDGGGAGGQGKKSIITGAVYAGGGGGGAGSSGGAHGRGGAGGGGNAGSPTRGCEGADGSAYGAGGGGVGRSCSGTTIAGDGYKGAVLIKWKAR